MMAGDSGSKDARSSGDLLLEIIETLEGCGLGRDQYQLHDSVDVEALEQLVTTSSGHVEARFTVEGIPLAVTRDGVAILIEE